MKKEKNCQKINGQKAKKEEVVYLEKSKKLQMTLQNQLLKQLSLIKASIIQKLKLKKTKYLILTIIISI